MEARSDRMRSCCALLGSRSSRENLPRRGVQRLCFTDVRKVEPQNVRYRGFALIHHSKWDSLIPVRQEITRRSAKSLDARVHDRDLRHSHHLRRDTIRQRLRKILRRVLLRQDRTAKLGNLLRQAGGHFPPDTVKDGLHRGSVLGQEFVIRHPFPQHLFRRFCQARTNPTRMIANSRRVLPTAIPDSLQGRAYHRMKVVEELRLEWIYENGFL